MDPLIEKLNKVLSHTPISARAMLGRFLMNDERSRLSAAYSDPRYIPAFYYLGREITPSNVAEFGLRAGLCGGAFLMACKTVNNYLAFQPASDSYYSPRIAVKNLKQFYRRELRVHVGDVRDPDFTYQFENKKWDLIMINDEPSYDQAMLMLNLSWSSLADNGLIIMDYVNYHKSNGRAYRDFCKVRNRDPGIVKSKYGLGLLRK